MGSSCSSRKGPSVAASPAKEKAPNGGSRRNSSFSFQSAKFAGSKEETFFDSRAWLDSDCDDDFFSVNGDFTPSLGSTPNNQIMALSRPKPDKVFALDKSPDSKSEPSPSPSPTGRKKLGDLFQQTEELSAPDWKLEANGHDDFSRQTEEAGADDPIGKGEAAPKAGSKHRKKQGGKAAQCCLPSLGQSFSFGEKREKAATVECNA